MQCTECGVPLSPINQDPTSGTLCVGCVRSQPLDDPSSAFGLAPPSSSPQNDPSSAFGLAPPVLDDPQEPPQPVDEPAPVPAIVEERDVVEYNADGDDPAGVGTTYLMKGRDLMKALAITKLNKIKRMFYSEPWDWGDYEDLIHLALEYEYAQKLKHGLAYRNQLRVLLAILKEKDRLILQGKPDAIDKHVLTDLRNQCLREVKIIRLAFTIRTKVDVQGGQTEFAKQLGNIDLTHAYPDHLQKPSSKWYAPIETLYDVMAFSNSALEKLHYVAAGTDFLASWTGPAKFALAPLAVTFDALHYKDDKRSEKTFDEYVKKETHSLLDEPKDVQWQAMKDARTLTSQQFAAKYGGRVNWPVVTIAKKAVSTHKKGAKKRLLRIGATVVGTAAAVASLVVTAGTASIAIAVVAGVAGAYRVKTFGGKHISRLTSAQKRELAAEQIIDAALTGEDTAIGILMGFEVVKNMPADLLALDLSDFYLSAREIIKTKLGVS